MCKIIFLSFYRFSIFVEYFRLLWILLSNFSKSLFYVHKYMHVSSSSVYSNSLREGHLGLSCLRTTTNTHEKSRYIPPLFARNYEPHSHCFQNSYIHNVDMVFDSILLSLQLQTANKQSIGVIRKKWGGVMKEMFTDSDCFHIQFPMDLDVRFKAAVIGTCFLIVSYIYLFPHNMLR